MKRIVLPAIVAIWGAGIVIRHFAADVTAHTSGPYQAGQEFAVLLGLAMAVLGSVYVVRALRDRG